MRILVLDDDCGEVIKELLLRVGHEVQIVADGDKAFKLYCDHGPFDIVLTDIDHPGMSAVDFQRAIFVRNPKQGFAFVTGYRVLQKPFVKEELYHLVDEMKPEGGTAQVHRSVKKIDAVIKSLSKKRSKPN
jgi:DNA-binding NtrC family response regulator